MIRTILTALALASFAGVWACNAIWGIPERGLDPGLVCDAAGCRCAAGFADCDHDMKNGCEADLSRAETCGACDVACDAHAVCTGAGACACAPGYGDCDGDPGNGCEADLSRAETCGACDVVCENAACDAVDTGVGAGACACFPGYGDCDGDPGNGCETTVAGDSQHCGACGHDCLGGDCKDGQCQPVVVAVGKFSARFLVLDGEHAYARQYCDLVRVPVTGGAIETLVPGSPCTTALAVRDGVVAYVAGSEFEGYPSQIMSLDTKVSGPPVVLVADADAQRAVAVNSTHVFWAKNSGSGDTLFRTPRAGGPSEDLWYADFPSIVQIHADDAAVFWQNVGGIHGYPFAAAKETNLVTFDYKRPTDFAFDADNVYWYVDPLIVLNQVPRGGGMEQKLAAVDAVGVLAADGESVYWSHPATSSVRRVRRDGTFAVVATDQFFTFGTAITVDAKAVYWFVGSGSAGVTLMKVAK